MNRALIVLVLAHATASLVHFAHNATYLADYPNMPAWLSPFGIYGTWLAEAAIGALGVQFWLSSRRGGLVLIAIYAGLGLGGLDHYTLAPMSAHTLAMNATIWVETATAFVLLAFVAIVCRAPRWRIHEKTRYHCHCARVAHTRVRVGRQRAR
jgi:hypothetical protein